MSAVMMSFCFLVLVAGNVSHADITIVAGGSPNADIITGSDHSTEAYKAALVLQRCVSNSYGATLPVLDSGGTHTVKIYVGDSLGSDFGYMDPGGFVINSQGSSIGIAGPTDWGTAFGVYEFLERYVGVRWLMPGDEGEYIPDNTGDSLTIPQTEVRQEPAFISRLMSGFPNSTQTTWAYRNRMYDGVAFHHNLRNLYKPSIYADWGSNPQTNFWPRNEYGVRYVPASDSDYKWQPRFTAAGIVQEAINTIDGYFLTNQSATSYSLGINDSKNFDVPEWQQQSSPKTNFLYLPDYSDIYYNCANQVIEGVIAPTNASLVGYWQMEAVHWYGEENEVRDASGYSHHGKAVGNNNIPATVTPDGKIGQAAAFDDANGQWLRIPSHDDFILQNYGTISAWVYPTKANASMEIILAKNGSVWQDMPYALFWYNNQFYGTLGDGTSSLNYNGPKTSSLGTNQWYHVVFTWDTVAGSAKLYLNGTPVDTKITTLTPENVSGGLGIGRNYTYPNYYFSGKMDEVSLWSRTLSTSEISNLYYNGTGKSLTDDKRFGCLAYNNIAEPPAFNLHNRLLPFITYDRMKWVQSEIETEGHALNELWEDRAVVGWYDYLYGAQYCLPRVYFHKMAEYYQYAKNHGVKAMYAEAYPNWGEGPKLYISLKLQWDPTRNVDDLLNEWYELTVGGNPDAQGTAAYYLKRYYTQWEGFWTNRVVDSDWWNRTGQDTYLHYFSYDYLDLVTREDIEQSREYLDHVVALAGTTAQQARAEMLMKSFEFYEAASMIYVIGNEIGTNNSGSVSNLYELDHFHERLNTAVNMLDNDPSWKRSLNSDSFFWNLSDTTSAQALTLINDGSVFEQIAANGSSALLREQAGSLCQIEGATTLIANPSFETGASPWALWHTDGTIVIDTTQAHTGTNSIKCTGTQATAGATSLIPFTNSGYYAARGYIKIPTGQAIGGVGQIIIQALSESYSSLAIFYSEITPQVTDTWLPVMTSGHLPCYINGTEVKYLRIMLLAASLQSGETAWLDDFHVFKPVLDGQEGLTKNGSFESSTNGWTITGGGIVTRDAVDQRSGGYSMKFTNAASASLEQTIDVLTVPLKYAVCGHVKTPQGQTNGTVKLILKLLDQTGNTLGEIASENITPKNDGKWESIGLDCDVLRQYNGVDVKKAKVVFAISGFDGTRQIWVDDLTVHQPVVQEVGTTPLAINDSFESGVSPWTLYWHEYGSTMALTTEDAHTGSQCILFTGGEVGGVKSKGGPIQKIAGLSGGSYTASAWIKVPQNYQGTAYIDFSISPLNSNQVALTSYYPTNQWYNLQPGKWVYVEFSKDVPDVVNGTTVQGISITPIVRNAGTNEEIYIDDAQLLKIN